MKKRPLCFAVFAVLVLLWLLPAGIWMKDPDPGGGGSFTGIPAGRICRMARTGSGQAVYLKTSDLSNTGIILVYFDAEQPFSIGNTIQVKGEYWFREPEAPTNPGQFDARLYYQTQGIVCLCYAKEAVLLDGAVSPVPQLFYELRLDFGDRIIKLLGERRGGILKAMLLGDKTGLEPEVQDVYQKSGMSHLLAISGLHVSVFGMSLYRLFRKLGFSYPAAGFPAMGLVVLYGIFTGMSTSTARAVIMLLLAVTADLFGKSYDMLTALAAAALLLLLQQPLYARSPSFLLSFGAVLGIGLLYPILMELFPVRKRLSQAILVSVSIQLLTVPLVQYFYFEIPLYSVFLNLLVIPLMTVLMFCGIAALLASLFSFWAARIPAFVCGLILSLYEYLGKGFLKLPGSVFICGRPKAGQMLLYYGGLCALAWWRYRVRERKKRLAQEEETKSAEKGSVQKKLYGSRLVFLAACALLHGVLLFRSSSGLTFTMLDVGQGDGLFLRTAGGTTCLIDGGSSSVSRVGTYRILPFLKSQGVGRLDYAAVTHTDLDHISGIEELLSVSGEPGEVLVKTLLLTEQAEREEAGIRLRDLAIERGTAVHILRAGEEIRDSSTRILCLHPRAGSTYEDVNAGSMVLKVVSGEFSMLLTGDLEGTGEQELLKEQKTGACDVLKAAHHGSRNSTGEAFLDEVSPRIVFISAGRNNRYGHPHQELLDRLGHRGADIYDTSHCGAVTLKAGSRGIAVYPYVSEKNATVWGS